MGMRSCAVADDEDVARHKRDAPVVEVRIFSPFDHSSNELDRRSGARTGIVMPSGGRRAWLRIGMKDAWSATDVASPLVVSGSRSRARRGTVLEIRKLRGEQPCVGEQPASAVKS
jgi:hypothetical protein